MPFSQYRHASLQQVKRACQRVDPLFWQDYSNLEIIISDNASTDSTQQICIGYSKKNSRVKCCRLDENLGAIWNFKRVIELSTGKYFMLTCVFLTIFYFNKY